VSERTAELEATAARLRANEESLRVAMDTLRDTDRRKDEFLAILAHELRNPLAPVSSAVEIMQFPDVDAQRLAWCRDVIARQVGHLSRLVDDLLDVSRITRGKVKLRLEALDLQTVIATAVETSRPSIEAHRHELDVQLPREPLRVRGDSVRLTQVVANLLNNAAKYQQDGGRIQLAVVREGGSVVIRVRDRGIGMSPEVLARVFEPFMQADQSLHRAQGGLGVGLSLVRSLVDLHGGSVRARSDGADLGSEFEVRLPALDGEPGVAAPDAASGTGALGAHRAPIGSRPTG